MIKTFKSYLIRTLFFKDESRNKIKFHNIYLFIRTISNKKQFTVVKIKKMSFYSF